ncbi:MAG TPA: GTP pyrophosphokinase [Clostridiaceae bacterium]|jgi:(p)ppGpp synthase/HD superfamily hydrolase|nr:GTP pyrophosphokinase [Clostridiaceae bacterium]
MLERAIQIAAKAHEGQKDKAGQPYILHPLRVMLGTNSEIERICAVLHDVIEDTPITLQILRDEGFAPEVLNVLDLLTKRKGESYDDFINRILTNETACRVKLADLADNMNLSRIQTPSEEDYKRVGKYQRAVSRIQRCIGI